jgi:hypothetical protein
LVIVDAWKGMLPVICGLCFDLQCGGEVLSMTAQVGNFTSLARRWRRENRTTAADLISRSLFFISVGSNDLFEHIDFPSAPNRNDIRFLQDLVASYTSYIKAEISEKLACLSLPNNPSLQLNVK